MTTPEKLEELARETAAKLIPHTTSVHNVNVISDALRQAAQSASVSQDVNCPKCKGRGEVYDGVDMVTMRDEYARCSKCGGTGKRSDKDTIEAQAAEIAELKAQLENGPRMWTNARAEAAEARIVELTRERDDAVAALENSAKAFLTQRDERDEARAQVTELTRERDEAIREFKDEEAIVTRIWGQLGNPTYTELNGRSIYDLIDELKALAALTEGEKG